ncbi:MAG: excinuclease ABC subunit A, partial [Blastopirellula sp.]|nr:excinuclease ABC subunit A [Blastopirellula sp.]
QGAAQHNLKSVDATVHRDRMTVFCGPSGSGKSSLAMDTIYAEGQRRYVESLSSYARQFVSQMQKPAIEHIEGLSPAIAIEQKNLGHTPRSTVGTVTEIYDYLRILLARLGKPFCPECDVAVGTQTVDEVVDKVLALPEASRLYLMAPVEVETGQDFSALWEELQSDGYHRIRVNGETHTLDQPPTLDRRRKHTVQIVLDRVIVKSGDRSRIAESIEHCLAVGRGVMEVAIANEETPESRWETIRHSQHMACDQCGRSFERLTPHNFSFNSHLGWCDSCEGLGTQVGANPAALLRDPKLTLAEGAVALWPQLDQPISRLMLEALADATGLPLDVPFEQLGARHRRLILHGAGEQWIDVKTAGKGKKAARSLFKFQYKGLYPALEEASRLSPSLRARLEQFVDEVDCASCSGSRLRDDASAVRFRNRTIDELCRLPLGELQREIQSWKLTDRDRKIAGEVIREIQNRVQFLNDVGLDYLSIHRGAATLSNGEAQRIRLASQLGSGLCGVLYVLDEPTIGLHPRDNTRLLQALHKLRDLGNTLLIVEHDQEVIRGSDYICDFGPGAGRNGGQIVANGTVNQVAKRRGSVTGPYLSGKKSIAIPSNRRPCDHAATPTPAPTKNPPRKRRKNTPTTNGTATPDHALRIRGARHHNLKNIDVDIPLGALVAITGPSGSGKSSLMEDVLYAHLAKTLHRANTIPGPHDAIEGIEHINKVIRVDQTPLGNSPTSNPATYTGVFELIRALFAQLPEAKLRGYSPRRFSFNVPGGRCDECEGAGQICIEMHFLPDVWVECETCRGQRYNPETLSVRYHGRSINDVLEMTCGDAAELFQNVPKIRRILRTLCDVGLEYLTLGQAAPTLSGGEAQRVKLAAELARPDTGRTLYLLDEPTTGLHFDDLQKLLDVMHRLVDLGNSVVVIEHNLDVIKQADWVIDLGPEAGDAGGQVVAAGTPETICSKLDLATATVSHTAVALAPVLQAGPYREREVYDFAAAERRQADDQEISDIGKSAKMPWEADGRKWHTVDRVGRKGEPCRWEGQILARVVDRIHAKADLGATNWNARSVVEIAAKKKSDGWFFHAITGEAWLLKMKFRVDRNTFNRQELERRIPLPTLNEMDEIPLYSNSPRVRLKTGRGPFQEVEVRVHSLAEVDHDEFWRFIDQMTENFARKSTDASTKLEDHMPWKKMGQKWHFLRKGFPPRKKIHWEPEVLEELHQLLNEILPDGHWLWNNQMLVNLYLTGQREPWARLLTKRPESLDLVLASPKNSVAYGRANELGWDREFDSMKEDVDYIRLKFRTLADLDKGDLRAFLQQHLDASLASLTS